MTELTTLLRALVAEQPAVADWPGLVRTTGRRRRKRRAVAAVVAAAAAVTLVGAAALVGSERQGSRPAVPAATPEPQPTADESTPVVVFLDPGQPEVPAGVPVDFVVVAQGLLEGPPEVQELIVDSEQEAPDAVPACAGLPPGAPEMPPRREHTEVTRTFTRTLAPGRHVVVVRASAGCSRPGGSATRTYDVVALP